MNLRTECHHQNHQNYPQVAPGAQAAAVPLGAAEHGRVQVVAVAHCNAAEFDYRAAGPAVAEVTADSPLPVLPYHPGDRRASASGR